MAFSDPPPTLLPTVVPGRDYGRGLPDDYGRGLPDTAVLVARGRYLLPRGGPSLGKRWREVSLARIVAVAQACPGAQAFSHESAALPHGAFLLGDEPDAHTLQVSRPERGTVVLPPRHLRWRRSPGRRHGEPPRDRDGPMLWTGRRVIHRGPSRKVDDAEITMALGLPVTTVEQTLIDCLIDLPARSSFVICDSPLRLVAQPDRFNRGSERDRPQAVRARLGTRIDSSRRPSGTARARRLLPLLSPWSESPGEPSTRLVLLEAGLPEPSLQHELMVSGRPAFLDMARPDIRLQLESDGKPKYADARYREKRRQEQAEDQGVRPRRLPRPAGPSPVGGPGDEPGAARYGLPPAASALGGLTGSGPTAYPQSLQRSQHRPTARPRTLERTPASESRPPVRSSTLDAPPAGQSIA